MLDSLALLLEKTFLLAHLNFFSPASSKRERCAKRREDSTYFERGDLLEVPRTLLTHFGIYLGDNKVAHLMPDILPVLTSNKSQIQKAVTNKRLLLGVIYKYALVRVDTVEDFAYGSPVLLNTMDTTLRRQPLAAEEVARRAGKLIGHIPYSLLWNNCEHFVTYCRYGTAVSLQTEQFCESLKSVIRDQRSVLLTTFIGMLSMFFLGIAPSTALPTFIIPFILWMAG
ncbi:lecithin retinol acyltransferase-like [Sinocyclocheilus anshuiensis]|uniref:Lecithin retinol acyltransferase-like n=1 Tax=Sinocyclocheilus anshuiensis TaxID=1608454 RepID=A0A671LET8_9TELE|nr:PREDICTED: lecithin retinol acyltransferase-like [Sinocyclocheilus anshuiensis]XP_016347276.1 PREDICTED: lecithin retinol acyltransferase-like [Sinocyclocheilus anshuiensis]